MRRNTSKTDSVLGFILLLKKKCREVECWWESSLGNLVVQKIVWLHLISVFTLELCNTLINVPDSHFCYGASKSAGVLPNASRSKWEAGYALGSAWAPFVEEVSSLFNAAIVDHVRTVQARPPNHQQQEFLQTWAREPLLMRICYVILKSSCSVLADSCIEVVTLTPGSKTDFSFVASVAVAHCRDLFCSA